MEPSEFRLSLSDPSVRRGPIGFQSDDRSSDTQTILRFKDLRFKVQLGVAPQRSASELQSERPRASPSPPAPEADVDLHTVTQKPTASSTVDPQPATSEPVQTSRKNVLVLTLSGLFSVEAALLLFAYKHFKGLATPQ